MARSKKPERSDHAPSHPSGDWKPSGFSHTPTADEPEIRFGKALEEDVCAFPECGKSKRWRSHRAQHNHVGKKFCGDLYCHAFVKAREVG